MFGVTYLVDKIMTTQFDPARVEYLLYWIKEREAIRQRREAGKPKPWTDNEVLQTTRFCNVRRMDDKVSKWMLDHWYAPHTNPQMQLTAAVLGRSLNWPDTLAELVSTEGQFRGLIEWRPEEIAKALQARKKRGEKIFTGAYIINGASGGDKINIVVRQANEAHAQWKSILNTNSMRVTSENLGVIKGIGSFMGGQIVADLRHVLPGDWCDKMYWAPAGPGSTRGMKWLLGFPTEDIQRGMNKNEFDAALQDVVKLVRAKLPKIWKNRKLECHDIQNCLCELDKFMRLTTGTGRAKNQFAGRAE